jgi:hemoglobin
VEETTLYDRVGGMDFFMTLVERFYDGVVTDEILLPMYPEDLGPSKNHLAWFLAQYWGGPATYAENRGHPRLRMRHDPYVINKRARDAWLFHMKAALDSMALDDADREELWAYLDMAAHNLRNR